MQTKSIIYQQFGEPIRLAMELDEVIQLFDRTPQGGTMRLERLTPKGTKRCFIARPNVLRIEEA